MNLLLGAACLLQRSADCHISRSSSEFLKLSQVRP